MAQMDAYFEKMEGLAQTGAFLGPPSTLWFRVEFGHQPKRHLKRLWSYIDK
jgi:hypothetical protein